MSSLQATAAKAFISPSRGPVSAAQCDAFSRWLVTRPSFESKAGQQIFNPGDAVENIYLVKEGLVKTCTPTKSGKFVAHNMSGPGEFFGLVDGTESGCTRHNYMACTVTPGIMRRISLYDVENSEFKVLLREKIDSEMRRKLRTARELVEIRASKALDAVPHFMIFLFNNYGKIYKDGLILPRISQQEIADFLNITRESVSKGIGPLFDKKLIHSSGPSYYVRNFKTLKTYFDYPCSSSIEEREDSDTNVRALSLA